MMTVGEALTDVLQFVKSFVLLFDNKTRKTQVKDGEMVISEEDNIDAAILSAWESFYGKYREDMQ